MAIGTVGLISVAILHTDLRKHLSVFLPDH